MRALCIEARLSDQGIHNLLLKIHRSCLRYHYSLTSRHLKSFWGDHTLQALCYKTCLFRPEPRTLSFFTWLSQHSS